MIGVIRLYFLPPEQEPPPMDQRYQIVSDDSNQSLPDSKQLAAFLAKDGQLLLPMLDLVEQAQVAIDDLIDVMGRATIEAVLQLSAAHVTTTQL